jgi:hypothetical protein
MCPKANSHIPRRSHAVPMPFPYHAVPLRIRIVFPNWFPPCGRVWVTHAMPRPSRAQAAPKPRSSRAQAAPKPRPSRAQAAPQPFRSDSDFSRPRHSTAWARHLHGMCELASAVESPLPPANTRSSTKVIRSIPIPNLNAGGQCETKKRLLKLIILVEEHECCIIYSTNITVTI